MKEMGLSRTKWTSPGWPSLTAGSATTGAMPRVWPSSLVDNHCGGRLGDHHMHGGRRPLGPVNVFATTEDRGPDIWRIKEALSLH